MKKAKEINSLEKKEKSKVKDLGKEKPDESHVLAKKAAEKAIPKIEKAKEIKEEIEDENKKREDEESVGEGSEEESEESETEESIDKGPFKFPFSHLIPREHRSYYEYHFSTDVLINPFFDTLVSSMDKGQLKEFLLCFDAFLVDRIAKFDKTDLRAKEALNATLCNCRGMEILLDVVLPEWLATRISFSL